MAATQNSGRPLRFNSNQRSPSTNNSLRRSQRMADINFVKGLSLIHILNNWLFIQTAQADKRVRHKVIPREVMDDALRYVVSHEVPPGQYLQN